MSAKKQNRKWSNPEMHKVARDADPLTKKKPGKTAGDIVAEQVLEPKKLPMKPPGKK